MACIVQNMCFMALIISMKGEAGEDEAKTESMTRNDAFDCCDPMSASDKPNQEPHESRQKSRNNYICKSLTI